MSTRAWQLNDVRLVETDSDRQQAIGAGSKQQESPVVAAALGYRLLTAATGCCGRAVAPELPGVPGPA